MCDETLVSKNIQGNNKNSIIVKTMDLKLGQKPWHLIKENNKMAKKQIKRYPIKYKFLKWNHGINKTKQQSITTTHPSEQPKLKTQRGYGARTITDHAECKMVYPL